MKIHLMIAACSLVLLTAGGQARAAEPMPSQGGEELSAAASSLVIGRITQLEGQSMLVEQDGETPIRVRITPETVSSGNLKVGDQVMVSLTDDAVAAIITSDQPEPEGSILDESGQGGRGPIEDR